MTKKIEVKHLEESFRRMASVSIEAIKTYEELRKIDNVDPSRRRFEAIACRGRNRKNKRK